MSNAALTIAALALACYFSRLIGFWGATRLSRDGFVRRWLNAMPGPLLVALVATAAVADGLAATVACAVILLAMLVMKNELLASLIGVVAYAVVSMANL